MLFHKKPAKIIATVACLLLIGCADNPGKWPVDKLEDYVKQALRDQEINVTEITLNPAEDSTFQGTAKAAEGETFKLVITRDPAARRITWDAQGDRGSFLDGMYELK